MKKLIGALFSIALALAVALPAAAATQGGKLVYARYADSLLLDPVFNDANVDIWITTNLYDTLFLPTDDGKDVSRAWPPRGRRRTTASPTRSRCGRASSSPTARR